MLPGSKSNVRRLLLILGLSAAFLFFVPMKNGKPLLSLENLTTHKLPYINLPDVNLPGLSGDASSGQVTVYKWQDASGNWHFSNEPPPGNTSYQTTKVDPNANLIQSEVTAPANNKNPGNNSQTNKSQTNKSQTSNSKTSNSKRETDEALEKLSDMIEPTRKAKNALRQYEQEELEKSK